MNNQLVILGVIVIVLCVGFSGCNQISEVFLKDKDRILGAWDTEGIWIEVPNVIVFSANGSFRIDIKIDSLEFSLEDGTWEMNNGILSIEMTGYNEIPLTNYTYVFSNDSKTLTITEVDTTESYVLQKTQ